ncbi:hypothetical protein SHLI107390_19105 [Shewanella livingstonensis]
MSHKISDVTTSLFITLIGYVLYHANIAGAKIRSSLIF